MNRLQAPADGDRDRAPSMLALYWAPFPIMVAMVGIRTAVRLRMRNFGMDDLMMILALLVYTGGAVPFMLYLKNGGFRHIYYIEPSRLPLLVKLNFVCQPFGAFVACFGKMSIAFLVLRIVSSTHYWRKKLIYVSMVIHLTLTILTMILTFVQCSPPRALWTKIPTARCWDPKLAANVNIAQSAFGTWQDLLLAVVPCTVIWTLSLSLRTRLSLCALLSLGVVACASSALKTVHMKDFANRSDITWAVYPIFMWGAGEHALLIIFGSVPPLKPLYDRWRKGKMIAPSGCGGPYQAPNESDTRTRRFGKGKSRTQLWSSLMGATLDEGETEEAQQGVQLGDTTILVQKSYEIASQRQLSLTGTGDSQRDFQLS